MFGLHSTDPLRNHMNSEPVTLHQGVRPQIHGVMLVPQLAAGSILCVSTLSTTEEGGPENKTRTDSDNTDNTTLAEETLVFKPDIAETGASSPTSMETGHSLIKSSSSSGLGAASTNSLSIKREALKGLGLSSRAIKTLLSFRKVSTLKAYSSVWSRFSNWCQEHSANPRNPGIPAILGFPQGERGLQPNTIAHQVSVLSSRMFTGSSGSLAYNLQITRFL